MEPVGNEEYEIRPVRPAEWRQIREVRLTALQDPLAAVAFTRHYAEEAALPDEEWQRRASGVGAQQFAVIRTRGSSGSSGGPRSRESLADSQSSGSGEGGDGGGFGGEERGGEEWVGMAVVIAERPDYFSVNAVYLRPELRGTGLAGRLFATVAEWTWKRTDRLYLWVHQDNRRAEAFYMRAGFVRTGQKVAYARVPTQNEYEMVLTRG